MAAPASFTTKPFNQQQLILTSMNQATGGEKGAKLLNTQLKKTAEKAGQVATELSSITQLVNTAKARTKTKIAKVQTSEQLKQENFGDYSLGKNLESGAFSSEQKKFQSFITKMRTIAKEIPVLDFSYFSEGGYTSQRLSTSLTGFAEKLETSELTFGQFEAFTRKFSTEVTEITAEALKTKPADLQKASETEDFGIDHRVLTLIVDAKKDGFKNEALILELAKSVKPEEFPVVFSNLFDTDNTSDFTRLFALLYNKHMQNLKDGEETQNSPLYSFLYYFQTNVENGTTALDAERRVAIQEFITDQVSKYKANTDIVNWHFNFIIQNPNYMRNQLGGASNTKSILTTAVTTIADGPVPDLTSMTKGDFKRLLASAYNTNHVERVAALITENLYGVELVSELVKELAKESEVLSALVDSYEEEEWSDEEDGPSKTSPIGSTHSSSQGYVSGSPRSGATSPVISVSSELQARLAEMQVNA